MAKLKPLYQRILRRGFDELPNEVRAMHNVQGILHSEGRCSVVRGSGLLPRLVAMMSSVPREGQDIPVTVEMRRRGLHEVWRRNFSGSKLKTKLRRDRYGGLIRERHGPITVIMRLLPDPGGLTMRGEGMKVFGIPMPRFLHVKMEARESVEDGKFTFQVSVSLPFGGRLVRYRGWLEPVESIVEDEQLPAAKPPKAARKRRKAPKPVAAEPAVAKPAMAEPAMKKSAVAEPAAAKATPDKTMTPRPPTGEPRFADASSASPEPESERQEPTMPGPGGGRPARRVQKKPEQERAVLVKKENEKVDRITEIGRG